MSELIDWSTAGWDDIGRDIVTQMKGREDDEAFLESLAVKAVGVIKTRVKEEKAQTTPLKQISRQILEVYDRCPTETPNYWYDPAGKADLKKWRHNIFKYLTLGRGKKQSTDPSTVLPTEQPTKQPAEQPIELPKSKSTTTRTIPTRKPKQILKAMTIEQLELDTDTQSILENALEHSGMPLDDFIKQAIKVYAKTITGKAKQTSEDLSNVPTTELLNNSKYSTHPARAEELTKRAIRAIKFFNSNKATENADRWCITQSAIASLTGSRQGTIKLILEQFKDDIETHNQSYGLNGYSNRKPGKDIAEIINLAELIPNGVD